MQHAFLIMAHNNFNQLKTLLRLLDDSRNFIYLHIDAKTQMFNPLEFEGLLQHAVLKLIPRIKITWGGYSQIECEVSLITHALKSGCDYYHLISGMDLPLHNMDYIDDFFHKHNGNEFIHFTELGKVANSTRDRIALYHPFQEIAGRNHKPIDLTVGTMQRIFRIDRLNSNSRLNLGKGANWFSISKAFAQYFINNWISHYKRIFSSSLCADELVLQTVILNSPYRENIYHPQPDDDYASIMRLIDWTRGKPYTFKQDDLNELTHSSMLFARKFDERIDCHIIDMIAEHLTSGLRTFSGR